MKITDMAIPTREALQKYWEWWYGQNREEIERHAVETVLFGRSYARMAVDKLNVQPQPWHEIFKTAVPTEVEEPEVFGFGEPMSISDDRRDTDWDKLPVPRTASELHDAIADYKNADMFFAMTGLPRAYMNIPTGFAQNGDYRMPPTLRVVYNVMAYKKELAPGEDGAAAEPELVECMWRDILYIRKCMHDALGDDTPVLFWRKAPEFTIEQCEGAIPRFAKLYMRLEVPGFDWRKYPVHSHVGDNSLNRIWPTPVSEAKKEEMRLADEVLRLSEASNRAAQDHLNAFHRLINLRSNNQFRTADMTYKRTERPLPPFYGPGVIGMEQSQQEQTKITGAMRQLLDSAHISSHPDGVALTSMAHPDTTAVLEERERQQRLHDMQSKLQDLDSGYKKQV